MLANENNADDAANFIPKAELCADELLEEEIKIKIEELRIRQLCLDLAKRRAMSKGLALNESRSEPVTLLKCSSNNLLARLYGSGPHETTSVDGTTKNFWSFMKTFEATLANKVSDDSERLSYLQYYCCGPAKEAIENCSLLEPDIAKL
jgi:hypothetical protein